MSTSSFRPGIYYRTLSRDRAQTIGESARPLSEILSRTSGDRTAHYHQRNTELCAGCRKGEHWRCTSLRCPCPKCNPVI